MKIERTAHEMPQNGKSFIKSGWISWSTSENDAKQNKNETIGVKNKEEKKQKL